MDTMCSWSVYDMRYAFISINGGDEEKKDEGWDDDEKKDDDDDDYGWECLNFF